jgi:hypothetical protein
LQCVAALPSCSFRGHHMCWLPCRCPSRRAFRHGGKRLQFRWPARATAWECGEWVSSAALSWLTGRFASLQSWTLDVVNGRRPCEYVRPPLLAGHCSPSMPSAADPARLTTSTAPDATPFSPSLASVEPRIAPYHRHE